MSILIDRFIAQSYGIITKLSSAGYQKLINSLVSPEIDDRLSLKWVTSLKCNLSHILWYLCKKSTSIHSLNLFRVTKTKIYLYRYFYSKHFNDEVSVIDIIIDNEADTANQAKNCLVIPSSSFVSAVVNVCGVLLPVCEGKSNEVYRCVMSFHFIAIILLYWNKKSYFLLGNIAN